MQDSPPPERAGPLRSGRHRLTGLLALIGVLLVGGACLVYGLSQYRSAPGGPGAGQAGPAAQNQTKPPSRPDLSRPTARVAPDGGEAELREEPSAESRLLETLPPGAEVVKVASMRTEDGTLWQWILSPSGQSGWLPADRLVALETESGESARSTGPGEAGGGLTDAPASSPPTPAPGVTPLPAAAETSPPSPTAAAAPRSAPTAVEGAVAGRTAESDPAAAVSRFYELIEAGDFSSAAGLWSPRMRASYPPAEHINSRFARVEQLELGRAEVVALDQASGRAQVAVELLERPGPSGAAQRWVGSWYLVRGPNGWLLDQPALRPA